MSNCSKVLIYLTFLLFLKQAGLQQRLFVSCCCCCMIQVTLLQIKWVGIGIAYELIPLRGRGAHTSQFWLTTVQKKRPKAYISSNLQNLYLPLFKCGFYMLRYGSKSFSRLGVWIWYCIGMKSKSWSGTSTSLD